MGKGWASGLRKGARGRKGEEKSSRSREYWGEASNGLMLKGVLGIGLSEGRCMRTNFRGRERSSEG